jgi:hypothetical protein
MQKNHPSILHFIKLTEPISLNRPLSQHKNRCLPI